MDLRIDKIPFEVRTKLCKSLNIDRGWYKLGGSLPHVFCMEDLYILNEHFKNGSKDPANEVLWKWYHKKDATVDTLYKKLHELELTTAMQIIEKLVNKKTLESLAQKSSEMQIHKFAPADNSTTDSNFSFPYPDSEDFESGFHGINNQFMVNRRRQLSPKRIERMPEEKTDVGFKKVPVENEHGANPNFTTQNSYHQQKYKGINKMKTEKECDVLSDASGNSLHFPYTDIQRGTCNFDCKQIIGEGGFGIVYKAELQNQPGSKYAVKRMKKKDALHRDTTIKQFITEINNLSKYRHPNIITLSGYSHHENEIFLIYEYMSNGSLLDHILCKNYFKPLTWVMCHKILRGAAVGLQYLHAAKPPLIHKDVKSTNILLNESMEPKWSDFGLSEEANSNLRGGSKRIAVTVKDAKRHGTWQYLPKDFLCEGSKFSIYSDVFSFGVVMLEVLTGIPAGKSFNLPSRKLSLLMKDYILNRAEKFADNDEALLSLLKDKNHDAWPSNLWLKTFRLAISCLNEIERKRPSMEKISSELNGMMEECQNIYDFSSSNLGNISESSDRIAYKSGNSTWVKEENIQSQLSELTLDSDGKKTISHHQPSQNPPKPIVSVPLLMQQLNDKKKEIESNYPDLEVELRLSSKASGSNSSIPEHKGNDFKPSLPSSQLNLMKSNQLAEMETIKNCNEMYNASSTLSDNLEEPDGSLFEDISSLSCMSSATNSSNELPVKPGDNSYMSDTNGSSQSYHDEFYTQNCTANPKLPTPSYTFKATQIDTETDDNLTCASNLGIQSIGSKIKETAQYNDLQNFDNAIGCNKLKEKFIAKEFGQIEPCLEMNIPADDLEDVQLASDFCYSEN